MVSACTSTMRRCFCCWRAGRRFVGERRDRKQRCQRRERALPRTAAHCRALPRTAAHCGAPTNASRLHSYSGTWGPSPLNPTSRLTLVSTRASRATSVSSVLARCFMCPTSGTTRSSIWSILQVCKRSRSNTYQLRRRGGGVPAAAVGAFGTCLGATWPVRLSRCSPGVEAQCVGSGFDINGASFIKLAMMKFDLTPHTWPCNGPRCAPLTPARVPRAPKKKRTRFRMLGPPHRALELESHAPSANFVLNATTIFTAHQARMGLPKFRG